MEGMLIHLHSGLRWIALIALVVAIAGSLIGWMNGGSFKKMLYSTPVYVLHVQLIIGLILYFVSAKVQFVEGFMKDSVLRFFAMEHGLMMIIGIVVITIGHARAKRMDDEKKKFKTVFIFYTIGLLILLWMIPWPWQAYGAGWG